MKLITVFRLSYSENNFKYIFLGFEVNGFLTKSISNQMRVSLIYCHNNFKNNLNYSYTDVTLVLYYISAYNTLY